MPRVSFNWHCSTPKANRHRTQQLRQKSPASLPCCNCAYPARIKATPACPDCFRWARRRLRGSSLTLRRPSLPRQAHNHRRHNRHPNRHLNPQRSPHTKQRREAEPALRPRLAWPIKTRRAVHRHPSHRLKSQQHRARHLEHPSLAMRHPADRLKPIPARLLLLPTSRLTDPLNRYLRSPRLQKPLLQTQRLPIQHYQAAIPADLSPLMESRLQRGNRHRRQRLQQQQRQQRQPGNKHRFPAVLLRRPALRQPPGSAQIQHSSLQQLHEPR
ncbi:hypothetical protein SAMN05444390_102522 [Marinobacterium lutimaris]|uniref:Uncharacterized protein n=1 Tax=Marinobacterium lutimaris TaxID=568106 RepID=A0A1H6BC72_9GAMM|nr:hypothetical protein SAMN05444390_102522 [Marinobacterium lutimaris]